MTIIKTKSVLGVAFAAAFAATLWGAEKSEKPAAQPEPLKGAVADVPDYKLDDFRNFFGLCWIGNGHDTLAYARQMGYKHVYYQWGMERDPLSEGMFFVIESPEYRVYPRVVNINKKYTPEERKWFELNCSLIAPEKPFPQNMATGWFFPPDKFTATLDLQQERVIEEITNKVIADTKKIEKNGRNFKFSGYAWDVPQPFGDFYSEHPTKKMDNGSQVTLKYWTGKDASVKHPDVTQEYATYSEGHFEFYRRLFEKARKQINPEAKWIVEPASVYNDWMRYMEWPFMKAKGDGRKNYMPDLVATECTETEFIIDKRNFESGLIDMAHVGTTTPDVFDDATLRLIAATAATHGSWTGWFGRPGGTGNNPGYRTINDMPARLKLNRAVAVWENLNHTPISQRKWDGTNYSSPTAGMTPEVIWALQPQTGKLFFVFLSEDGKFEIPAGYKVDNIYHTDGLFRELEPVRKNIVAVRKNRIVQRAPYISGVGFVAHLKKIDSEK
mgnify:FL=1